MKALILAAGEGTRLRPLTLGRPKPMLPIGGKPLLQHLVTWLRWHGITEVAINLYHRPRAITDYFGDDRCFGVSITYSYEDQLLGTAGAAKKLQPFFDGTFVVVYGDVFTNLDLTRLIRFHTAHKEVEGTDEPGEPEGLPPVPTGSSGSSGPFGPSVPFLTLSLYRVNNPSACGVVELDGCGRVTRFVEKPPPDHAFSNLANAGVLVVEPGIPDYVPPARFFDFGHHLFPLLLGEEVLLYGYPLRDGEFLIDIGTPASYRQAQEHCAHWFSNFNEVRSPFDPSGPSVRSSFVISGIGGEP